VAILVAAYTSYKLGVAGHIKDDWHIAFSAKDEKLPT
jgi:hypothetical protein